MLFPFFNCVDPDSDPQSCRIYGSNSDPDPDFTTLFRKVKTVCLDFPRFIPSVFFLFLMYTVDRYRPNTKHCSYCPPYPPLLIKAGGVSGSESTKIQSQALFLLIRRLKIIGTNRPIFFKETQCKNLDFAGENILVVELSVL